MPQNQRYTTSTGRDRSKLRTYRNLFGYFRRNRWLAERDYRAVFGDAVATAQKYLGKPINRLRVLEVGHGQHASVTLLFHSSGAGATGIDMDYGRFGFSPQKYWRIYRLNGFERALKTLARNILFDPAYYRTLRNCFGQPLKTCDVDLRRMDAAHQDFADNTFDYVFSFAVFEHIADVKGALREVARVLKPDGVANISIDLYPSLAGGHNLEWAFPNDRASRRVPAWDHLRTNQYLTHVYLNKLHERDYLDLIKRDFDILEVTHILEGEQYLTSELERELTAKGYARQELITRTLRVVLRPKKSN
ncbi:MAG: class I SAM-dependent methyltransferase [Parcubacteria group bacterium]